MRVIYESGRSKFDCRYKALSRDRALSILEHLPPHKGSIESIMENVKRVVRADRGLIESLIQISGIKRASSWDMIDDIVNRGPGFVADFCMNSFSELADYIYDSLEELACNED